MACKRSAVRSRLPPPKCRKCFDLLAKHFKTVQVMTLSSRGLGHHPFTVSTGVRIPVGSPSFVALGAIARPVLVNWHRSFKLPGVVVQLVRIPACHAGGRGFESRPLRQKILINQGLTKSPICNYRAFLLFFGSALSPNCPQISPFVSVRPCVNVPRLSPNSANQKHI